MTYRQLLCLLIKEFAPNGIGVEIGVKIGATSNYILKNTTTKHLYMIDPWKWNYSKTQGLYSTKRNPDDDYQIVAKTFAKHFSNRSTIIRKKAEDATHDVPSELDFIFIDGNHEYEYVMKDLTLWVPKMRSGGLVVGHDWWSKFPGVNRAVVEFCKTSSLIPLDSFKKNDQFIPAPASDPVVMKSWPHGHLWWSIRR